MPYEIVGYEDEGEIGGLGDTEIVGAEIVAGDDDLFGADEDLLDALSMGARRPSSGKKALLRKVASKHAVAVTNQPLRNRRRFPIGFVPTTVAAGTTGMPAARPLSSEAWAQSRPAAVPG